MSDAPEAPVKPLIKRIFSSEAFIPVTIYIILIFLFFFSSQFLNKQPEIISISPEIGYPGDVMTISGKNFGDEQNGSEINIAGLRPVSASYIEWRDESISVRIPDETGSGIVTVTTDKGTSGGILFTNRAYIPVILSGPTEPGYPYIESISPVNGPVGALVTITGLNFGHAQGGHGEIFFTSAAPETQLQSEKNKLENLIAGSDFDFDYESWSDQEIKVHVPDGALSGSINVSTDRGLSNGKYFEVTGIPGSKIYTDKKGYQVQYGIKINKVKLNGESSLDIWVPGIFNGLEQKNFEFLHEVEPVWNFNGVFRYHFSDISPDKTYSVLETYWFDRYGVETRITASKVNPKYDESSRLYREFTKPDLIIPSESKVILENLKKAAGRDKNPYKRARLIYNHIAAQMKFQQNGIKADVPANYLEGRGNAYDYAVLFCAFARASGIPARPVSGAIVYSENKTTTHFWAEFFIQDFGWVPVDPAFGDEYQLEGFPYAEDPADYYFGNLDSSHITLTRGLINISPINPDGMIVRKKRFYSFQTIHEEASENISSYNSIWNNIRIIDWW